MHVHGWSHLAMIGINSLFNGGSLFSGTGFEYRYKFA